MACSSGLLKTRKNDPDLRQMHILYDYKSSACSACQCEAPAGQLIKSREGCKYP